MVILAKYVEAIYIEAINRSWQAIQLARLKVKSRAMPFLPGSFLLALLQP